MIFIGLVNCQYLLSFCCTSSKTALANSTISLTQGSSSSPPKFSINHWILALSFSVGTKYRPGMSGISPFQARGTPSSKILHRLPVPIGPHGPVESPSISRIPGELLSHTILKCTRLHQPGSPGRSSSLRPGWEARPFAQEFPIGRRARAPLLPAQPVKVRASAGVVYWAVEPVRRTASACNFKPSAFITLRIVSNPGLRSPDSAL